jgi:regulator of RNase E activity RraA
VHLTALDVPVSVFGLNIAPGDLIHADRHGAVVIKPEHLERLAWAIDLTTRREAPILAAARKPGFDLDALYRAWGEMEDVH